MENLPQVEDTFYIVATETTADEVSRVLKDGETFAVFDRHGDIRAAGPGQEGLYHEGTRYLSHLVFKLGNARPFLLNSSVTEDNLIFVVNMTNADVYHEGAIVLPRGTLHITRQKLLRAATCYETFRFINYGLSAVDVAFSVAFAADFADIFEVRGMTRERRGTLDEPTINADRLCLGYKGLDGRARRMRIECSPSPERLTRIEAVFRDHLGPRGQKEFCLTYACETGASTQTTKSYPQARREAESVLQSAQAQDCKITTSHAQFNEWLVRSSADLHMMFSPTPFGLYPYAGVPWFSTAFGRDGILTALEYLWVNAEIAKGVLGYLASLQAREDDAERDAETGKILHETRTGEMAALREIPFDLYYGSVDATPLFIMLAAAYLERTGDLPFIRTIWPNIELAIRWMDQYGDSDGDGFIEYARHSSSGLIHQGWKDSWDSVSHQDGSLAHAPITLCEVQAYAYAAKVGAAAITAALDNGEQSRELLAQAATLQKSFEQTFWSDELGTYAMALDGDKRQCRVGSSNAGHCLYAGIAGPEQARRVAAGLMSEDSFSGWGVRTLSAAAARYNPMSYHNGSVWPHDNAMVAAGLARYGFKDHACKILGGLFQASLFAEYRLPELFCGFTRQEGEGPVPYPVACSPQSWAAAAVFLLLQAVLGMKIDAAGSRLFFVQPVIPQFLDHVSIKNLRVNDGSVDLFIVRRARFATVEIERRVGQVEVFTAS
jgi:glycogen debranching enzyme